MLYGLYNSFGDMLDFPHVFHILRLVQIDGKPCTLDPNVNLPEAANSHSTPQPSVSEHLNLRQRIRQGKIIIFLQSDFTLTNKNIDFHEQCL